MNKFILQVKLTGNYEYGLEITILHWDKKYLSYPDKENDTFGYHMHDGFIMFSSGDGKISSSNIFSVPMLNKLKKNHKISHNFYSDNDRYIYLKQLFYCLQDWGLKHNELNKDIEPLYNEKIKVSGDIWIM